MVATTTPVYPAIPDPSPDVNSLAETVRVLKQAVEALTGQGKLGAAARVFVQDTTPTALGKGDLWIQGPLGAGTLRYWNGSDWVYVTVVTNVGGMGGSI